MSNELISARIQCVEAIKSYLYHHIKESTILLDGKMRDCFNEIYEQLSCLEDDLQDELDDKS